MRSFWNDSEAVKLVNDPLKLRVYTSRLLGQEEDLVLHGGGNTSVKTQEKNIFGEEEDIIYVKGSGWDLATIEEAGFAPVKLDSLLRLAQLEHLSDTQMVRYQRMAMTDPSAPNPSVEAILHAIIPFTFVDHTHADAVVTISNTSNGSERIHDLYGDSMLIVPYVMPGFVLAREIYHLTKDLDWNSIQGIILLNHGVFTFHDDARVSYEKMIEIVTKAEAYLEEQGATDLKGSVRGTIEPLALAQLRKNVSQAWGAPVLACVDNSEQVTAFSSLDAVDELVSRGPLTPDHIIRTKRTPLVIAGNPEADLNNYIEAYNDYFDTFNQGNLVPLDPAPRWTVWPLQGTIAFGTSVKNIQVVRDITRHTLKAIHQAEKLGGWHTLGKKELFEMEYWILEQEKLKKDRQSKSMQGKVALVTGAASGIGRASVERLTEEGAAVAGLDIDPAVHTCFDQADILSIECDVTATQQVKQAIRQTITQFGGLDMLVSNAGIFPKSSPIGEMDEEVWNKSMGINLTSHQQLLLLALPYLEVGIDPAVVIIGSKNVPAPGPGAAAYSVAKAGLTQLARIAALELGPRGIRVNTLHPNAIYDTGLWTEDVMEARSVHYGLTVEAYKRDNVLKTEITSKDVANTIVTMLGPSFSKITGAQLPIDGGNIRVI